MNRLEALVAEVFPEYFSVMKGYRSVTSRYLLGKYKIPQKMAEVDITELTLEIRKTSRYQLGFERALKLHQAAKNSIGATQGNSSIAVRINNQILEIELLTTQLQNTEKELIRICKQVPSADRLQTTPGLGWITVATIFGEIGDINKFKNSEQVIRLAGLNLYEISSGTRKGQKHITKKGRSLLRKILFYAALRMIKKDGIYRDYYEKGVDRGNNKYAVITAVVKKLIRLIFALVRDDKDFDLEQLTIAGQNKRA